MYDMYDNMHNVKNRTFRLVLDKAGLRRIRMHDLRHFYGFSTLEPL